MSELTRFVHSFQKALQLEMAAMREQLGSFEVALLHGQALGLPSDGSPVKFRYDFSLATPNEKLAVHMECTLRREKSEYLVKIVQTGTHSVQLECGENIPLAGVGHVLVIYPWFLYEKLLAALAVLTPDHNIDNALRLFGLRPHQQLKRIPPLPHGQLNDSQQRAIEPIVPRTGQGRYQR